MNRFIAPGDRVMVTPIKNGITHKSYIATVIAWMLFSSDDVKKLANKQA